MKMNKEKIEHVFDSALKELNCGEIDKATDTFLQLIDSIEDLSARRDGVYEAFQNALRSKNISKALLINLLKKYDKNNAAIYLAE